MDAAVEFSFLVADLPVHDMLNNYYILYKTRVSVCSSLQVEWCICIMISSFLYRSHTENDEAYAYVICYNPTFVHVDLLTELLSIDY